MTTIITFHYNYLYTREHHCLPGYCCHRLYKRNTTSGNVLYVCTIYRITSS